MSMAYIRETYHIPVKRGLKVMQNSTGFYGRIVSCSNYVKIRWDVSKRILNYHPTDPDIAYVFKGGDL